MWSCLLMVNLYLKNNMKIGARRILFETVEEFKEKYKGNKISVYGP